MFILLCQLKGKSRYLKETIKPESYLMVQKSGVNLLIILYNLLNHCRIHSAYPFEMWVMICPTGAEQSEARKLLLENNTSSYNYTEQDTFPTPNCRVQKKTKGRKRLDIQEAVCMLMTSYIAADSRWNDARGIRVSSRAGQKLHILF